MTSGPELFTRFAYPPNSLGYCGPGDASLLGELMLAGPTAQSELRRTAAAFDGAWPYLGLIGGCTNRDPLDPTVVEAYWLGSRLLESVDLPTWGNTAEDRFRRRAGFEWDRISGALNMGGVPNHAFHVFCAYPWVGLLRTGAVTQALDVLDRCRIRWGEVIGVVSEKVLVRSAPLVWDGQHLSLGPERTEQVGASLDPSVQPVTAGDSVAMHWDYICQVVTPKQLDELKHYHGLHLAIANSDTHQLAARLER